MVWPLDRFRSWNRSRGLQNTFQVSVRTSASPRAVCAPQIQKVLECLASIIKFMIFRNLNFWIFKKPLTVIWTLKFFESFPDWSDPKRVCPYQLWGSRNPFWKSHICLRPPLLLVQPLRVPSFGSISEKILILISEISWSDSSSINRSKIIKIWSIDLISAADGHL